MTSIARLGIVFLSFKGFATEGSYVVDCQVVLKFIKDTNLMVKLPFSNSYLGMEERRWAAAQRRQSLEAPDHAGKVLLMPDSQDVTLISYFQ